MKPTIHIVHPTFIVDTSSTEGLPPGIAVQTLAPGLYVALRRIAKGPSGFLRAHRFFGPFPTLAAAKLVQTSATALGVVGKLNNAALPDAAIARSKNRAEALRSPRQYAVHAPLPLRKDSAQERLSAAPEQCREHHVMPDERSQPCN